MYSEWVLLVWKFWDLTDFMSLYFRRCIYQVVFSLKRSENNSIIVYLALFYMTWRSELHVIFCIIMIFQCENILLDSEMNVKLSDFGFATVVDESFSYRGKIYINNTVTCSQQCLVSGGLNVQTGCSLRRTLSKFDCLMMSTTYCICFGVWTLG